MKWAFILAVALFPLQGFSQIDIAFISKLKSLDTANILKLDTSAVPDDALTQKIKALRKEKTGLSLETIMLIKISEEQQKDNKRPHDFYDRLKAEISSGHTSKLLDNCFVNIYRRTFTESEIDDLLHFYQTSAGKKFEREFLPLLVESAKAAEQLLKIAVTKIEAH